MALTGEAEPINPLEGNEGEEMEEIVAPPWEWEDGGLEPVWFYDPASVDCGQRESCLGLNATESKVDAK